MELTKKQKELELLLQNSSLTSEEREVFIELLSRMNSEFLDTISDLFKSDPSVISTVFENLLKKGEAIFSGDEVAWKEIINSEEAYLSSLSQE